MNPTAEMGPVCRYELAAEVPDVADHRLDPVGGDDDADVLFHQLNILLSATVCRAVAIASSTNPAGACLEWPSFKACM